MRYLKYTAATLLSLLVLLGLSYLGTDYYVQQYIEAVRMNEYTDMTEESVLRLLGTPNKDEPGVDGIPGSPGRPGMAIDPEQRRTLVYRTRSYLGLDKGTLYIALVKKGDHWLCSFSKYVRDGVVF